METILTIVHKILYRLSSRNFAWSKSMRKKLSLGGLVIVALIAALLAADCSRLQVT